MKKAYLNMPFTSRESAVLVANKLITAGWDVKEPEYIVAPEGSKWWVRAVSTQIAHENMKGEPVRTCASFS